MDSRAAIHALVEDLRDCDLPEAKVALERLRANGGAADDESPSAYEKVKNAGLVGCLEGPPRSQNDGIL